MLTDQEATNLIDWNSSILVEIDHPFIMIPGKSKWKLVGMNAAYQKMKSGFDVASLRTQISWSLEPELKTLSFVPTISAKAAEINLS